MKSFATWLESGVLERSWLPEYFAPDYIGLDRTLEERPDRFAPVKHFVTVGVDKVSDTATVDAQWLVTQSGVETYFRGMESAKLQRVPENSLVFSPLFLDRLDRPVYWSKEIFGGEAVTDAGNIVLTGRGHEPIAWMVEEFDSEFVQLQLKRIEIVEGITLLIAAEQLLELKLPRLDAGNAATRSRAVIQRQMRAAAYGEAQRQVAEARKRLRPFVLTGATFEERLRQFERHLTDYLLERPDLGYFVQAASHDTESDLFVVRELGDRGREHPLSPTANLRPNEDPETEAQWRRWYWTTDPADSHRIFNSLTGGGGLPTHLLSRTTARSSSLTPSRLGRVRLPNFLDYRNAVEIPILHKERDSQSATEEALAMWRRINGPSKDPEKLVMWLSEVYRPCVALKVLRDGEVAGVYVLFGLVQEPDPERSRVELEALGSALSEVLRQPAELADEAARRESLRRLSWFMHQLAGPLMRLRNSIDDLQGFVAHEVQLGDALVPNADAANRAAAMTGASVASYSVRGRLQTLAGAVDEINRLQYQIRAFRNAQRDLEPELIDLEPFLLKVAQSAREQLPGLRVEVECEPGLRFFVDRANLKAAFDELVANSCREFRARQTIEPGLALSGDLNDGTVVLRVRDNALPTEKVLPKAPFDEDVTTYATQRLGTGLGLAIVHEIIVRHRGRCTLTENRNAEDDRTPGVTFSAEMPILYHNEEKELPDVS